MFQKPICGFRKHVHTLTQAYYVEVVPEICVYLIKHIDTEFPVGEFIFG
jgi:hypothetical protein